VGKWHLGLEWQQDGQGHYEKVTFGPGHLGFDYYCCVPGGHNIPPFCLVENNEVLGELNTWRDKNMLLPGEREGWMTADWDPVLVEQKLTEKSLAFIKEHHREHPDEPFLLYHAACSPHLPCVYPETFQDRSLAGPRGDMVTQFDWTVGQIHDCLAEQGLADDTLIIVTSDNGARRAYVDQNDFGHKSCGDWRGFKTDIWEGGHRVPFVVRWPGQAPAGSQCNQLVCLTDLMATLAELHQVDLSDDTAEDSESMLALLQGQTPKGPSRDGMIYHSYDGMFAIRKGEWVLVEGLGSGGISWPRRMESQEEGIQLFNLEFDSRQQQPHLWKLYPEKAEELQALLNTHRDQGFSRKNLNP
jgi:arylsulfatase A-like enzyme